MEYNTFATKCLQQTIYPYMQYLKMSEAISDNYPKYSAAYTNRDASWEGFTLNQLLPELKQQQLQTRLQSCGGGSNISFHSCLYNRL